MSLQSTGEKRGVWGSKIGFILAAAGSAIGLGNIWRFPYVTGQNGGAAFVLLYIIFVILIGLPVMVAELSIGRRTRLNPVGAFAKLAPKSAWKGLGILGVVTGIGILSYYSVIAGWTFGYFIKTLTGEFAHILTSEQSVNMFNSFVSDPLSAVMFLFLFIVLTASVVLGGVSHGIERWVKVLMPILLVLLVVLTLRSITLPGAGEGFEFYLKPDFSKMNAGTVAMALGQALFSLSLGMGAMITYGSYISKEDNLINSAGWVVMFDTLIAIMAGLLIFPALFAINLDPSSGASLVFIVLPTIFDKMPLGAVFGSGFFLLLTVAALTSTISLLEVCTAYAVDEFKWKRARAVTLMAGIAFVLGVPSALSFGGVQWLTSIPGFNLGFLDLANIILGNYSLTIGAFLVAIFAGYKWGVKGIRAEIESNGNVFYFRRVWAFLIRFICPIAILLIFIYIISTRNYF